MRFVLYLRTGGNDPQDVENPDLLRHGLFCNIRSIFRDLVPSSETRHLYEAYSGARLSLEIPTKPRLRS